MSGRIKRRGGEGRVRTLAVIPAIAFAFGFLMVGSAGAVPIGSPTLPGDTPADSTVFQDVSCEGAVTPVPTEPTDPSEPVDPEEDPLEPLPEEDVLEYDFSCDKDVFAFSIVSNREVGSYETEMLGYLPNGDVAPGLLDGNQVGVGEDFFCVGSIPAFGVGCYANPLKTPAVRLNTGNTAKGKFALAAPLCEAYEQPQFSVVVMTELGSYNDADTTKPPVVKGPWVVTSEPIPLDTTDVECDQLTLLADDIDSAVADAQAEASDELGTAVSRQGNLYEKALKVCSEVGKANSRKARSKARANCTKATRKARAFRA